MIYEYKVLYNAANVVEGYEYNIITGYDTNSNPILATFTLIADGIANDRVSLQGLLDTINDQGGGILLLPPKREIFIEGIPPAAPTDENPNPQQGSYPLTVYSNIEITSASKTTLKYGEFMGSTIMRSKVDYSTGSAIYYPLNNFKLNNLLIKGFKSTASPTIAIFSSQSSIVDEVNKDITISNCDFIANDYEVVVDGTTTQDSTSYCVYLDKIDNLIIDNCTFSKSETIIRLLEDSANISISNSEFKGGQKTNQGVFATKTSNFVVEGCKFSNLGLGVSVDGLCKNVYIRDNVFEPSLTNNPIRVTGSNENNEYTDGLWISGNNMKVKRSDRVYLENPLLGIQRYPDGRVIWTNEYTNFIEKPIGVSAINITCAPQVDENENIIKDSVHHQNVVVADNIAIGSDYGFYDGGSGDLFSLKDIIRLKCYGNTSRNSGDLGFAIERCHFGVVNNNTADRNNSCGISVFDSTHINVIGNVCSDNELSRDGAYLGNPYGGIRIERSSIGVLVEGNYCYANSGVKRSYVNGLATAPVSPNTFYNQTGSPTQQYGVVVKNVWNNIPHNIKIGNNHTSGMLWGNDYTNIKASQVLNTYTGSSAPTEGDYPLGTRLRNNLNVSSTASTNEWQVVNHIRMKSIATSLIGSNVIKVVTLNSQNSDAYKLIENNDLSTILAGDIIGIKTDKYFIHWASVVKVTITVDPTIGDVGEIEFTPVLPENASYTVTNLTIGANNENVIDDKDVVSLRWEAL